ncbi:MAG: hypothetical protein ACREO3_02330 [Arenimonas sp.]
MKAAWLALGLGTLALVAWIALRPVGAPSDDGAAIRASLERIEHTQAQQAERLARLERHVAPGGSVATYPGRVGAGGGVARSGNVPRTNGAPLDPVQAMARQQAQLRSLEDRLVRDPLSATWAAQQERVVDKFLAPASLAREGLPAPRLHETRCQSHLCRIRLGYADEATALAAQVVLLQAIAPTLPHARSFVLPRPDGGADLLVFAGGDAQAVR